MTREEFLRGLNDLVEHEPLDQLAEHDEKLGELMRRVVDRARTILEAEPCPESMPAFKDVEVSIELEPDDV